MALRNRLLLVTVKPHVRRRGGSAFDGRKPHAKGWQRNGHKTPLVMLRERIKRKISRHLRHLGFSRNGEGELCLSEESKESFRSLHREHRKAQLERSRSFLATAWPKLQFSLANGADVDPRAIRIRLEPVEAGTWQSDLFRLATLSWSIPVSNGFGRRIRLLVWDDSNGKLIGIIGLTDPVFNLSARDSFIGWDVEDRRDRLVHMMDAHVLGAIAPYNQLLGGKLVASLIRTREVRDLFRQKYGNSRGLISGKKKDPRLVAITTSSALGKSSVYSRLALGGIKYLQPIGFTAGYGHFHIPEPLFSDMRRFLKMKRHPYANGHKFGTGPNWKLRSIRACLGLLNVSEELLCHSLHREVFICPIADNICKFLKGEHARPHYGTLLSVDEVAKLALHRWVIPRSERRPEFRAWTKESFIEGVFRGNGD